MKLYDRLVANKVANTTDVVANSVVSGFEVLVAQRDTVVNKHGEYADKEKRKAYMREYMKKRRAQKKSA